MQEGNFSTFRCIRNDIRQAYGISQDLTMTDREGCQAHSHVSEHYNAEHKRAEGTHVGSVGSVPSAAKANRESQKLFSKKPIQFETVNIVKMIFSLLFQYIVNKFKTLWEGDSNKKKNEILFLASGLKNHNFVCPKQLIQFKEDYLKDEKLGKETAKSILKTLFEEHKIDRKNYFHLSLLLHEKNFKVFFQYIFGLSSIANIHSFDSELLNGLIQPQEHLQMMALLEKAHVTSIFDPKDLEALANLTARLEVFQWLKADKNPSLKRQGVERSLQDPLFSDFQNSMVEYLNETIENSNDPLEKKFLQELGSSFKKMDYANSIIHFAQTLESLSILKEWENKLDDLQNELSNILDRKEKENAEGEPVFSKGQTQTLLEDLQELYIIFGKILDNENASSFTPVALSLQQGLFYEKWKSIGKLIDRLLPGHHTCGCLFDSKLNQAWPDVEASGEIVAAAKASIPDQTVTDLENDKKSVLFFYCNWGNGHRAAVDAMQQYLDQDQYHIAAIDLPQTTLRPLDPVQNLVGADNTVTTLYNTLVAGRHWKIIQKIVNHGESSTPNEDLDILVRTRIREQILKQMPDIVVVDYATHAPYILDVAQELGIPVLRVHTDMYLGGDNLDSHNHRNVPHFKKLIPYDIADAKEHLKSLGKDGQPLYDDKQIELMGYPIRPTFIRLAQEIQKNPEKIKELRRKYHIAEDEVVYLVSNGGCGSATPLAQMLKQNQNQKIPNGHVFVLTGRNAEFKAELDAWVLSNADSLNPDIKFQTKGFISDANEIAELLALASSTNDKGKTGIFIGKAGGASIGEAGYMGCQMIIDRCEDNKLIWEAYSACKIRELGFGDELVDPKAFINMVIERSSQPASKDNLFIKNDPEKRFREIVKQTIRDAKADSAFKQKRTVWKSNDIFMKRIVAKPGKTPTYSDSIHKLHAKMKAKALVPLKPVCKQVKDALSAKKPCAIDFNTMEMVALKCYDQKAACKTVQHLILQAERGQNLDLVDSYLQLLMSHHSKELEQDYSVCRKDPFLMDIAYLDRLLVKARVSKDMNVEKFWQKYSPIPDHILGLYKTPLAKKQYLLWVNKLTQEKKEPIFHEEDAIASFVFHPDQYQWIINLEIHHYASTYGHKLEVNEQGEVLIPFEGESVPASALMQKGITAIDNHIVSARNAVEYLYDHEEGLKKAGDSHRSLWTSEVPLFKKIERDDKDWRLEILSDVGSDPETGDQQHTWIRLKKPTGEVYSIGRNLDEGLAFSRDRLAQTLPGSLISPDFHEFMPREKDTNIIVTEIDLGEGDQGQERFNKIMERITTKQKNGLGYNLINNNCVSFVGEICQSLKIPIKTKVSILEYLFPSIATIKFTWLRDASIAACAVITALFRWVLWLPTKGFTKHPMAKEEEKPLIHSVGSYLNPFNAMVDAPYQLRNWQMHIRKTLGSRVLKLNELIPSFSL